MKTATKKEAIAYAKGIINDLRPAGFGNWLYTYYCADVDALRESTPRDYYHAQMNRRFDLIRAAKAFLDQRDMIEIEPGDWIGGRWESWV